MSAKPVEGCCNLSYLKKRKPKAVRQTWHKNAWARPIRSDSMGVNPEQIPAAMEADKRAGITGVSYDAKTGEAIYSCRKARRDHCRVHYVFDKDAAYSDPQHQKTPDFYQG